MVRKSERMKKRPEKYGDYVFLTYRGAVTGPDRNKWTEVICEEKKALRENNVWEVQDVDTLKSQKSVHAK